MKNTKITKKNNTELVVKQDNFFIQYSNQAHFNEIEKKILCYSLALYYKKYIDNDKKESFIDTITLNINDIIKTLYNTDTTKNYATYYKIIIDYYKEIRNKGIMIYYKNEYNEESIYISSIISSVDASIKGKIKINYDKRILKDFIGLFNDKNYTIYRLENIIKLNNKYAIKLYEILKSYENLLNNNNKIFSINESIDFEILNKNILKIIYNKNELFNILLDKNKNGEYKNKSYIKNYSDFKKRIIKPTIENINNANIDIKIKEFAKDTENKDNYIIICEYIKNNKSYNADNKNIYKTEPKENKNNKKYKNEKQNEQYNILFDKWEKIGFGV